MVYSPKTSASVRIDPDSSAVRRFGSTTRQVVTATRRRGCGPPRPASDVDRAQPGVQRPEHERQREHHVHQRQDQRQRLVLQVRVELEDHVPGWSRPHPSTWLTPATRATGEMTSGSMQIVSTTGRARGSRRWIASMVGTISTITIAMVSSATQRGHRTLGQEPAAANICLYGANEYVCRRGLWTVNQNAASQRAEEVRPRAGPAKSPARRHQRTAPGSSRSGLQPSRAPRL